MSCQKTKLIPAYLDEELQGGERAALETHVQGCAQCGTALKDMRSLRAAFASTERHPAPYGFATRVMALTRAMEAPSPGPLPLWERIKRGWFAPFVVGFAEAAVLIVVITVGILAGRVMTNSNPAMPAMNIASSLSIDMFDPTPPGSLGGAYLAMLEVGNEK